MKKKYVVKFDDTTEMEIFIGISDNKLFYDVYLTVNGTNKLVLEKTTYLLDVVNLI